MASTQRIGLRQVRALEPGEIIWDSSLPGFGARRQRSKAVSYVLFYRTEEGRQRWYTIGRHRCPLDAGNRTGGSPTASGGDCQQGRPCRQQTSSA
jgi:hypothetical protein